MSENKQEEKLRSVLKNIYHPVHAGPAARERILSHVLAESSAGATMSPRNFFFRPSFWVMFMAVVALTLISFGLVLPPG